LDFRCDAGCPAVSYIDVECNSQNKVADTFADFLDQMELDLENERVLGSVANIDDARNRLETLFKSKFENRISNIGVSFLTCQTGKEWDECFWISSNVVAHGYSGDGEESFEFKGEALLFPELPEHAVIFQAPSSRMDRYSSQLRDAGYELVEIEDATTP
jgi:hypothetical protein